MRERVKSKTVSTEAVTIRLHSTTLEKVDKLVEAAHSNRTDIIRRALAVYFRLGSAVLVPVTPETRRRLCDVADRRLIPAEALASDLLREAVKKQHQKEVDTFQISFVLDSGRANQNKRPKFDLEVEHGT